jgi:hypothetical protein
MTTTVTANPAENGVAPGLASVGFGTGSFTSTPDGAGFTATVSNVDQVARFQVVAPEPGATLVGWGIDTTSLEDIDGGAVGDFFMVLVDSDDNFVGVPYFDPEPVPPEWVTTGDIIDAATVYVVPWFSPYLQLGGFLFPGDFVSGTATVDVVPPIVSPSGYWIEIIAFAGGGVDMELVLGRVKTIWEVSEDGWVVGSVGFPGHGSGLV